MVCLISSLRKRNSVWRNGYGSQLCTYRWGTWAIVCWFRSCSRCWTGPWSWSRTWCSCAASRKSGSLSCSASWVSHSVPADVFLDDAPTRAHLVVDLVQLLQLPLLPLLLVQVGVQEVDPLLAALDLAPDKPLLFENLRNHLPFFGTELRMELRQQLDFLYGLRDYLSRPLYFFFGSFHQ